MSLVPSHLGSAVTNSKSLQMKNHVSFQRNSHISGKLKLHTDPKEGALGTHASLSVQSLSFSLVFSKIFPNDQIIDFCPQIQSMASGGSRISQRWEANPPGGVQT